MMSYSLITYIPAIVASISIALAIWVVFFEKKHNIRAITDNSIGTDKTALGIADLTSYVSKFSPDYLVCLNRGGILVGSHVSLLLEIPTERLLKCSIKRNEENAIVTNCDISSVKGKVLIIDSMIRTGETFSLAIDYLNSNTHDILEVRTASLVTAVNNNGVPIFDQLSYYVYETKNGKLSFPWTHSKDIKAPNRAQMLESEFNEVKNLSPNEIVRSILIPSLDSNLITPCK